MNKAIFSLLFSLIVCSASSQRIYFIYLQTESQQPFFVKLDDKIHSSTASGYLILSRLKDSSYNFTVGFPANTPGEQKFTCNINKKDHGYLLKNFGEKGWGLLDLQTLTVQMAVNVSKKDGTALTTPVNAFTDLLAKAADDSTLKQKNVLPEEKKAESVAIATVKKEELKELPANKPEEKNAKTDATGAGTPLIPASTVIKQKEDTRESPVNKPGLKTTTPETITLQTPAPLPANTESKKMADTVAKVAGKKAESPVINEPAGKLNESFVRTKVARKSESSTTDGFGILYIDTYADGSQDTIRLEIPNDTKIQFADTVTKDTAAIKVNTETPHPESAQSAGAQSTTIGKGNFKYACKTIASDADFYKLRKKMAGGKSDVDMLDEAKKSFRAKCFTTGQIKNLGALFLGDGGKYNFFDAAYQHISDVENFASLQSELKDMYFINRFKAILH